MTVLRKLKVTKRELFSFLVGIIVTKWTFHNQLELAQKNVEVKEVEKVDEPEKEFTLTDECLQNMDPEKLDFQQVAKLRHPNENENGDEDVPIQRSNTFLLVLIVTGPFYADKRKVIRETWLSRKPSNVKFYFVVGTKNIPRHSLKDLSIEHRKYKDLLMLSDFEDSYDNFRELKN